MTRDAEASAAGMVLVVDLDGTLLKSDMLHETFWAAVSQDPRSLHGSLNALRHGKPALKSYLAERASPDPATLPYDPRVLSRIEAWRAVGGRTALVTATDARLAEGIAAHLGLFDEVHGTSPSLNLKGEAKAAFLTDRFGAGGFHYMGDSAADLAVWAVAGGATSVGASKTVRGRLDALLPGKAEHLPPLNDERRALRRALRPHQWLKNTLVFIPLLADLVFTPGVILAALVACIALSLVASAGYVLNDLLDLADDRSHPRKRERPFASGALSAARGTMLAPLLLMAGVLLAGVVNLSLLLIVTAYFIATMTYSIKLKRHSMVDICVLAALFTARIIAGAVAVGVPLSVWLLAFSMFLFFSLAAVKRLAELTDSEAAGRETSRRGYQPGDRSVLSQMAVASGYLAVMVLALYIDEPIVQAKFGAPWFLWGICPLLIFWVSRMVLISKRGEMHDDPLVWALTNRTSQKVIILSGIFYAAAVLL